MTEQSLVLLKPDAVDRRMVGALITRYESKGLVLRAMKLMRVSTEMARAHYAEHAAKPFFNDLVHYITRHPLVAMVWEGDSAVAVIRKLNGATHPRDAEPGSIRGDFALNQTANLVHASDSVASAARETALFFKPNEILEYTLSLKQWF